MATIRGGWVALIAVGVVGWAADAGAGPTKAQTCEATKLTAAGKKAACLAGERAKEVKGGTANYAKCDEALTRAFASAESKAGAGVCPSEHDAAAVEKLVGGCFADLQAALTGSPNPPCVAGALPATGQTTCWDSGANAIACAGTGQDGDVQAGGALSYTDNGDGTITDNTTGLMWQKKSSDVAIHSRNTTYNWADAFAVHIAGRNAGAGFAGHTDWRLPNIKEVQSIVNYATGSPAVSPAFNTRCVAGCTVLQRSCSAPFFLSSTAYAGVPPTPNLVTIVQICVTKEGSDG